MGFADAVKEESSPTRGKVQAALDAMDRADAAEAAERLADTTIGATALARAFRSYGREQGIKALLLITERTIRTYRESM